MKEPFLLLRTRIFFAMILLVFVSFLLIGITTSFQIRENSLYYHELRLDRKEAQLQRAFKILFNEKSLQPDNQLSYLFNRRPDDGINISTVLDEELKDEIFKISDVQNIDFTLYDLDGTLVDTAPDLMRAHNHVMKKFGYPTKSTEEIRNLVGKGAGAMIGRSIWGLSLIHI